MIGIAPFGGNVGCFTCCVVCFAWLWLDFLTQTKFIVYSCSTLVSRRFASPQWGIPVRLECLQNSDGCSCCQDSDDCTHCTSVWKEWSQIKDLFLLFESIFVSFIWIHLSNAILGFVYFDHIGTSKNWTEESGWIAKPKDCCRHRAGGEIWQRWSLISRSGREQEVGQCLTDASDFDKKFVQRRQSIVIFTRYNIRIIAKTGVWEMRNTFIRFSVKDVMGDKRGRTEWNLLSE